jgi:hypothetical protein
MKALCYLDRATMHADIGLPEQAHTKAPFTVEPFDITHTMAGLTRMQAASAQCGKQ